MGGGKTYELRERKRELCARPKKKKNLHVGEETAFSENRAQGGRGESLQPRGRSPSTDGGGKKKSTEFLTKNAGKEDYQRPSVIELEKKDNPISFCSRKEKRGRRRRWCK